MVKTDYLELLEVDVLINQILLLQEGKKIIIKSVGANGYVQSSEGITSLSGTSKSTSAQSVSKSVRSFLYTGTTYGWMMGY